MTRKLLLGALLSLGFSLCISGCGAIFNSAVDDITVSSSPPGATVTVDGQMRGVTPLSVSMTVDESHVVSAELAGYAPVTERVERFVGAGWVVLDVLNGLIGIIIDAAAGGWYELDREAIHFNMIPLTSSKPSSVDSRLLCEKKKTFPLSFNDGSAG